MAKDAGVPLKFTGEFDGKKVIEGMRKTFKEIEEEQKKAIERLKKMKADAAKSSKYGGSDQTTSKATNDQANATKNLTERQRASAEALKAERAAKLANIEAIAQYRQYLQQEKQAVQDAKKAYEQGRITLQTYRLEIVKANRATRERAKAEREAKKALAANSEYQKLNKALGELRTRSKNVLAEMFKLEGQGKKNTIAYHQLADEARGLVAQTQYLDRGLKKIDASLGLHQRNVGNYGSALDAISPQFARLNSQLAMMGVNLTEVSASKNGFKELGSVLVGVGRNIGAFLISPIGLAITGLTSLYLLISRNFGTIKEFNSGLLNVSKTTGIAGAELTRLGDSIISLSRQLQTVGTDKLLEYATVAGQLGVKGTKNIMAFTEALAKLETASNISGEEGGAEIARMLTLVDGGVQNVAKFGDEIVNLGNNFAATEKEILGNAEAIAQNTGIYRFGRQDVLAYATATKSVGLEAEVVGSTFSRTLGTWSKFISTGKNLGGILELVGGTAEELSARFKTDASGVFLDYIRGLNKIHASGGDVNATLRATGVVAVRDQRVIASLASNGYGVLEDAMLKVRDAAGALDQEFATKAGSLENQIGRISIAWNNLVLDIENGEGVLGQAVVRFADGLATVIDRLAKIANPTGWNEFIASLTNFDQADMIREMNIAFTDAETTLKSLSSFDVSTANQDKLREKYAEIESATAALNKQYEAYKKSVNEGVLTEGGKARLDEYKRVLDDLSSYMWQLNRNIDPNAKTPTGDTGNGNDTELDAAAKRAREAALKGQRDLQKQIDELNRASLKSTLEKDQQEVESVREKYRKIRQEIDAFRKDPKNKGFAVDASGLSAAEAREVAQVRYRQETTELVKSLGLQRELWQEYEAWRMELGEESARERYASELDIIDNFKANIKREIASIGAQLTAALTGGPAATTLTGAESERLKQLQDLLKQITDQEQKQRDANLRRVLTDYASFETKRVRLHKQAEEDMKLMDEAGRKRRKKALDDELIELYRSEIEGNERFQEFMKTVDSAGSSLALSAMKHARGYVEKLVDNMKITPAEKAKLRKEFAEFFDQGIAAIEQENFGNITNLVEGFGQLVASASQFDGTMNSALKTVGEMVGQVGKLAQTLSQTLGKAGDSLSKGGGYAAIIGAVLSVASAISEGFNQARQRANEEVQDRFEMQNDRQLRATEAITRALEMQLELINEIYGADRLNKYAESLEGIKKNWQDINRQLDGRLMMTTDNFTNSILARLNNGESAKSILKSFSVASSQYYQAGNILDNIGRFDRLSSLPDDITEARDELAKLQYQAALGNVDDYTQKLIDQLAAQIDLYDQTMNRLREENTGNAFSTLLDEVETLFRNNGADSAEAWTKSFNKILENYMMQKFSREWLDERVQDWYSVFDEFAKSDGLNEDERKELRKQWDEIQREGQSRLDAIRETMGLDGPNNTGSETGLRGGIERMTEQTASELTGLYRATYELQSKYFTESSSRGKGMANLMVNQLQALNSISGNTADTVRRLDAAISELQGIRMNTKPGLSSNNYERL